MTDLLFDITREDNWLSGWFVNPRTPNRPILVEISVNERKVAQLLCADRVDWREIGVAKSDLSPKLLELVERNPFLRAGFKYRVPTSLSPAKEHDIRVSVIDGRERISVYSDKTTFSEQAVEGLKGLFANYTYVCYDRLLASKHAAETLEIEGWVTPPPDNTADRMSSSYVTVNGVAVETEVLKISESPDPLHFSFWPDRPFFSFRARVDLSAIPAEARGYRISLVDDNNRRLGGEELDVYLPANWQDVIQNWTVPPVDNISRTTPTTARRAAVEGREFVRSSYLFSGYTDLCQIERILQKHTGRDFSDMTQMLDWGSGCGRLVLHMANLEGVDAHGVDIDPDNIDWSNKNISGASFQHTALFPPLPFNDNTFDLVTGLSVYTHLSEVDQFAWLEEHKRILKPGGILAVTVSSLTSMKRGGLRNKIDRYRDLMNSGISDEQIGNKFVDLLSSQPAYYRNTSHRHDYIQNNWSSFFDVAAIEQGGASGQQDLVIGVKRKD